MSGAVKVPGVEMTFEGMSYVVPPMNAAAVEQYRDEVAVLLGGGGVPDILMIVKLLHAALSRNYPEVTVDQVKQWVDFGNMVQVLDTVMHVSGLVAAMGELNRRMQGATTAPPALTH